MDGRIVVDERERSSRDLYASAFYIASGKAELQGTRRDGPKVVTFLFAPMTDAAWTALKIEWDSGRAVVAARTYADVVRRLKGIVHERL